MTEETMVEWPAVPLAVGMEVVETQGAYLTFANGSRVLDAAGQACVANIGYGRTEVTEAIAKATAKCTHVLPPFATDNRLDLVRLLKDKWLPDHLTRIHFVNSGSEAADTAIKLARQFHFHSGNTEKWKVIGREFSYHGVTLGGLSVSGHADRRRGMGPLLARFPLAPACYPYRCEHCLADQGCTLDCADKLEQLIVQEGADTVAAFMAEPVVGTSGGALVPHDEYWPKIQEICKKYNVLLILDEVITGFGRTGARFALEHWDIKPDIITSAKGMSGGYAPIGLVATSERVVTALADNNDIIMFHTFGGHNGACAASLRVLEILEREQLLSKVNSVGGYLGSRLEELTDHPYVGEVRGMGMLWAVELVRDKTTREPWPKELGLTMQVMFEGVKRGVLYYFGGTGTNGDVIALGPPFIITRSEVDTIVDTLRDTIDAVTAKALVELEHNVA